jgi:hypothetical protein
MSASSPRRLLVVANRTAATPTLLDVVRSKAGEGTTTAVTLLVPAFPTVFDPEALESRHTIELAIPLLEEATGTTVRGIVGDPDPFAAVQQALKDTPYDEVIISTLPARVSRWLKRDLPQRVERLGVPVTVVTAPPAAAMMGESMVRQTP